MVLVAFKTGFKVALPNNKPVAGVVSVPAANVKVIGPDIALTAFKSVSAFASEV